MLERIRSDFTARTVWSLPTPNRVRLSCAATIPYEHITMQIQTNTDRNISGHEALAQNVEEVVGRLLGRFSEQAHTVNAAVTGASHKMIHLLESELGKLRAH